MHIYFLKIPEIITTTCHGKNTEQKILLTIFCRNGTFLPEPGFSLSTNVEVGFLECFGVPRFGVPLALPARGVRGDLEPLPECRRPPGDFEPFELLLELAGVGGPGFLYTQPEVLA